MSESRRVLVCPRCGAPLPPAAAHESVTCAFCQTTSEIAKLAGEAKPSDKTCPRCEQRLFFGDAEGVAMLGCGLCGGIWLDNDAAQKVADHYSERVVEMANRASKSAARRPDLQVAARCAECRTEMQPRTFGTVTIDICADHGTWFDAGELATLVSAARPEQAPTQAQTTFDETSLAPPASKSSLEVATDVLSVAEGAFELVGAILSL